MSRTIADITHDVTISNQLSRDLMAEMLELFPTRDSALHGIRLWCDDHAQLLEKIAPRYTAHESTLRLLSSVDSYGINWPDKL